MAQIDFSKSQVEFAARQVGRPYYRNRSGRRWMAQSVQTLEPNFPTSTICIDRKWRVNGGQGQQPLQASGLTGQR